MNYWTETFESLRGNRQTTWRAYCDALNCDLVDRWWAEDREGRLLKTDLFEEAIGSGLYPRLRRNGHQVFGIDYSPRVASEACFRHAGLLAVNADVRKLPFAGGIFDGIVSTSTLDHFPSRTELVDSMHEIARVLRPGGKLILTLDNPGNPVIRLRQALPYRFQYRIGILPYFVGYTCSLPSFRSILSDTGFDLIEALAIAHCPRLPAILLARWADTYASPGFRKGLGRALLAFEALAGCPTRFLTGNYFAVRAVRRD